MVQAFGQTSHLNVENLLARLLHLICCRNKRMRVDGTHQFEVAVGSRLTGNKGWHAPDLRLGGNKGRVRTALSTQQFDVNLRNLNLRLQREALAFAQLLTVFENHGIAAVDDVLCRFSETAAGINVATHRSGTLLGKQLPEVLVFANQLIGGRKIEDDVGSCQRETV